MRCPLNRVNSSLVNTGVLLIFYCTLLLIYHTARNPDSAATAVTQWSFWIALALILIVPVVELIGIRRMIRRKLEEEGLWPATGSEAHVG
jgi:membrane protein implicated in regulation of membrane protease activity